jgi:hypothetical protein
MQVLEGSTVVLTLVVVVSITVLFEWILHQHCQHLNMSLTLFISNWDTPL